MVTWRAVVLAVVTMLALGACRAIAGLHDLEYASAPDGACVPALPSTGDGRVRLVDTSTVGADVDFCIRPTGSAEWGTPVFAHGGPSCQSGLEYAQSTVPFAVPTGSIDVESIPAGSPCSATPTSQVTNVAVGNGTPAGGAPVVTIIRMGGASIPEQIVALPEESANTTVHSDLLRFVNTLSGGGPINLGLAVSPTLPTQLTGLLPQPIAPGSVEPPVSTVPQLGSVDAQGYVAFLPLDVDLGVVFQGQTAALFVVQTPVAPVEDSVFAIGDPADPAHPVRGLVCPEDALDSTADAGHAGSLLAPCVLTSLPSLAVDTFNLSLYGADAPFPDQRRPYVFAAIAARTSDLMCVLEADSDADKATLAKQASSQFPYAFYATTTLDTAPTDPTGLDGGIPAAPTAAPCAGQNLDPVYQCVAANCVPGDAGVEGTIQTASCLTGSCISELSSFYLVSPQQTACLDCMIYNFVSEPLSVGQSECTTDKRAPFAFAGMTPSMILSHYPLADTQAFILPSTGFRRAVLYATVQLEDQDIDFYCAQLSSALISQLIPYEGQYGQDGTLTSPDGGTRPESGWEVEQNLQVQKVIAFIRARSQATGRPAIIAGDWHATIGVTGDGGAPILVDTSPEVMAALDSSHGGAFARAVPPNHVPSCEFCPAPENPYNGQTPPEDMTQTFLFNFPAAQTIDDEMWGTDPTVVPLQSIPHEPAPGPTGPISEYYPRLVRVVRPLVH